jgi:uncharacterized protein YjbI with pentapeptide repeats
MNSEFSSLHDMISDYRQYNNVSTEALRIMLNKGVISPSNVNEVLSVLSERSPSKTNKNYKEIPFCSVLKDSLANALLKDLNYKGVDFSIFDLNNCKIQNCNFAGSKLKGVSLANSILSGNNFNGVDFTGADFTGADFGNSTFRDCDFTNAKFSSGNFLPLRSPRRATIICGEYFTIQGIIEFITANNCSINGPIVLNGVLRDIRYFVEIPSINTR